MYVISFKRVCVLVSTVPMESKTTMDKTMKSTKSKTAADKTMKAMKSKTAIGKAIQATKNKKEEKKAEQPFVQYLRTSHVYYSITCHVRKFGCMYLTSAPPHMYLIDHISYHLNNSFEF